MTRRFLIMLMLVTATVLVAPTAQAGTRGCVTRHEFYSVHKGMSMAKVHRVWGTTGRITARDVRAQSRGYRICGVGGQRLNVFTEFVYRQGTWRLYQKWANAQ